MKRQSHERRIHKELTRVLDKKKTSPASPGPLVLEIGKFFAGAPYKVGTLEPRRNERLVVNLREFDCSTFVENVVALARCMMFGQESLKAFRRLLLEIRYRNGRLQGYASRLHYFTDWVHDSERKAIARDITAHIGGKPFRKIIDFMTTHPDLYPALKDVVNLQRMKLVERRISRRSLYFIPKTILIHSEHRILDGDIIAITTNTKGLDVQHVGFAVRVNNRVHLLHASVSDGKVILARQTLYRYLMQSKTRSGIIVARLVSVMGIDD